MDGGRRCASGAISRPTRGAATSPSMPSRSASTALCTTTSADLPISHRGVCVFIGEPAARIREDYLRILRFFRFNAEYSDGPLDPAGLSAALRERQGLAILSRERVRLEFLKLLAARRAVEVVETLALAGFALRIIRGVVELGRLSRAASFEHEEGGHPDPIHRLAALAVFVAEDADRLRELLRLSNAEHERLAAYSRLLAKLSRAPTRWTPAASAARADDGSGRSCAMTRREPQGSRPPLRGRRARCDRRFAAGREDPPVLPVEGADRVAAAWPQGPKWDGAQAGPRSVARPRPISPGESGGAGLTSGRRRWATANSDRTPPAAVADMTLCRALRNSGRDRQAPRLAADPRGGEELRELGTWRRADLPAAAREGSRDRPGVVRAISEGRLHHPGRELAPHRRGADRVHHAPPADGAM